MAGPKKISRITAPGNDLEDLDASGTPCTRRTIKSKIEMKMEPNQPYKIEDEPNLLSALQSDLADVMADQTKASQLLHRANDKTFDLMRKIIAIKKSK